MRRLKASKGAKGNTLTMFAEKYLVNKTYCELSNVTMKFAFPEPGPVEGKPTIVDVNLTCVWRSLARTAQVSTRPSMSWSVCSSSLRAPSGRSQALALRTWLSTPSPP